MSLAWEQEGGEGCLSALGASALGFLIHWPVYCRGGLGGGDVKLFSAYCAFSGLSHLPKLILTYGICLTALLFFMKIKDIGGGRLRRRSKERRIRELDPQSDENPEDGQRVKPGASAPMAPWMAMAVILSML